MSTCCGRMKNQRGCMLLRKSGAGCAGVFCRKVSIAHVFSVFASNGAISRLTRMAVCWWCTGRYQPANSQPEDQQFCRPSSIVHVSFKQGPSLFPHYVSDTGEDGTGKDDTGKAMNGMASSFKQQHKVGKGIVFHDRPAFCLPFLTTKPCATQSAAGKRHREVQAGTSFAHKSPPSPSTQNGCT